MSDNSDLKVYAMDEIAKHKATDDLWIVYNGLVYDVSKFIDEHPGGEEVVVDVAGTDATEAFDDIGHSDDAHEILKGLLIGKLEGGVTREIKSQLDFDSDGPNYSLIAVVIVGLAVGAYFFMNK